MKKKILAALVTTMAVGTTCAFAANPFVDVPTDSWAYSAVVQLANAGVINGVNGSDFQGNREITRYEAAEMTAKAMANMDRATMEQRALINKLADEYADELNSLGVRVTNLENKVGNVKLTGDFRLRYRHQEGAYNRSSTNAKGKVYTNDQFQYRARLRANAYVNDSTKVVFGVSTGNKNFNDETQADQESDSIFVDDAYVKTHFGKNAEVQIGRWDKYILGNALGLEFGSYFDAAQTKIKSGHFVLTGGFGQFKDTAKYDGTGHDSDGNKVVYNNSIVTTHSLVGVKTGYAELEGKFDKVGAGIYYNGFNGDVAVTQNLSSLFGGYLKFDFGTNWDLMGEYQKIKKNNTVYHNGLKDDDAALWGVQLTYGNANYKKLGSWDAWVEYVSADPNSLYGNSNSWRNSSLIDNVTSWGAGFDYIIAKNTRFSFYQSFATALKNSSYSPKDQKPGEETRAELVFKF